MRHTLTSLHDSLAYAELYKVLAAIVPRFDFELYETSLEDVHPIRDAFVPLCRADSKGIRVKVL